MGNQQQVPDSLPAGFQGWDGGAAPKKAQSAGAPYTLPADFNKWDENGSKKPSEPGFFDTLKREGRAALDTVEGIPGVLYHSAVDPSAPDEPDFDSAAQANPQGAGGAIAAKAAYRNIYKPVANAAEFYYDAAKGNNPNAATDLLSAAPEGVGSAGGAMLAGEAAGRAVPAIKSGIKALPEAVESARAAIPKARSVASKTLAVGSKLLDNDVAGIIEPRLQSAGRMMGRAAERIKPQPVFPKSAVGPKMESGAFTPVEGEYLPPDSPAQLPAGREPETLDSFAPTPEPSPAPYRKGPGQVPAEDVRQPNPDVLGGKNGGVRVAPPVNRGLALPEAPEPFQGQRASRYEPVNADDRLDTKGLQETMREDLANHGKSAYRDAEAERTGGVKLEKPKWERQQEARELMKRQQFEEQLERERREAEMKHANPLRGLPPVTSKARPTAQPPVTTPDDLTPLLEKSVKQAQERKAGKSQNFEQFIRERGIADPGADHGLYGPSGKMSSKAERSLKSKSAQEFENYGAAQREYQAAVDKGEIVDPSGKHSARPTETDTSEYDGLMRQAQTLEDLANRGMKPRAYKAEAARLRAKAKDLK